MKKNIAQFVTDYMTISCDYCEEEKGLVNCNGNFTKCLDKALYMAHKMTGKGWDVTPVDFKKYIEEVVIEGLQTNSSLRKAIRNHT